MLASKYNRKHLSYQLRAIYGVPFTHSVSELQQILVTEYCMQIMSAWVVLYQKPKYKPTTDCKTKHVILLLLLLNTRWTKVKLINNACLSYW